MNSLKVLVTGHKGYIGKVLVEQLLEKGHIIHGIDIGIYELYDFLHKELELNEHIIDLRSNITTELDEIDAIIHLGALSNDPTGQFNPQLTNSINYEASVKLAHNAKEVGVKRFLFSSSCSVYGRSDKQLSLNETDKTNAITEYAKSKLKFEDFLNSIASDNFWPIIMRNSTVYGFSPSFRMDLVVNNLVGWGYFTKKINILGDGMPWRPLIHVRDLSNIFCKMLEAPSEKVHNQVFNIGFNEENYRVKQIAEIISKIIPDTSISIAKASDPDSRSYRVNFDKLNQTLEIRKEWDVKKGVKELFEFLKKGLMSKQDFLNKKHVRLTQLKKYETKNPQFFEI